MNKRVIYSIFIFIFVVMVISPFLMGNENGNENEDTYTVVLPEGKLPWPHHRPDLSLDEYENLLKNLWIINNFGQYQASEDASLVYFHDGVDVVLDNGTKLYAVESGYVKAIKSDTPGYGVIIIGDSEGDKPGNGWMYAHVDNFQFQKGDYVRQGDHIADVYFEGLEHVHLGRIVVEEGDWEQSSSWYYVQPDKYFVYEDTQPPVINLPFYYFYNNTDTMFENTKPMVVWGDVDIVVGIRDPGEHAHSKESGYGDRLCITRIEYEICGENTQPVYKKSFDFTKMIINNWESEGKMQVFTVFKHYKLFHEVIDYTFWDKMFSYYVITNSDGTGEFGKIDPSAADYAWNTAELDEAGNPRFPNGLYTITVTAYDFLGNHRTVSDTVMVKNIVKKGKIRR